MSPPLRSRWKSHVGESWKFTHLCPCQINYRQRNQWLGKEQLTLTCFKLGYCPLTLALSLAPPAYQTLLINVTALLKSYWLTHHLPFRKFLPFVFWQSSIFFLLSELRFLTPPPNKSSLSVVVSVAFCVLPSLSLAPKLKSKRLFKIKTKL